MWGEVGAGRRRKATSIQVVGEKTGHVGAMKLGRPWWRSKAMRHHRLFGNWVVTCSLDGSSDQKASFKAAHLTASALLPSGLHVGTKEREEWGKEPPISSERHKVAW